MMALDAKPDAAHYKLAEWEAQGKCRAVVTRILTASPDGRK